MAIAVGHLAALGHPRPDVGRHLVLVCRLFAVYED